MSEGHRGDVGRRGSSHRRLDGGSTAWVVDALWGEAAAAVEARCDAELLEDASAVREAEWGRLGWDDRWLAAARGRCDVRVYLSGEVVIRARVAGAGPGLAILVGDLGRCWAVDTDAVVGVCGLPLSLTDRDACTPGASTTLTWGMTLRACVGRLCSFHLRPGRELAGVPLVVGGDAVDVRTGEGDLLALPTRSLVAVAIPVTVFEDLGLDPR